MKKNDIEAYLEGSLNPSDQEAFEQKMTDNKDFAKEVIMYQQLASDLKNIGLSNTIRAALLEETPSPVESGKGKNATVLIALAVGILVLLGLIGGYHFLQNAKQTPETIRPLKTDENQALNSQNDELPYQPSTPPKPLENTEQVRKTETNQPHSPTKQPIAQADDIPSLTPPLHRSPNLRGSSSDNAAWKAFLDKIWYTAYPIPGLFLTKDFTKVDAELLERNFAKAYIRLQRMERKMPQNDTLRLLKGYCLIEMGEGQEALRNFENLEDNHPEWIQYLQWHRGLGHLLMGEKETSKTFFQNIAKQNEHAFQQEAKKALVLMDS